MHKKNKDSKKSSQIQIVKGKLDISKSGMGYVIVEGFEKDIMVRPNDFNHAFHGDIVRVQVNKGLNKDKRQEGRIVDVAERKQKEFIGNIQMSKNFAFFIPATEKPIPDFYIATDKLNGAKDNERVIVKFVSWEKNDKKPIGEVVAILKSEDENDMAMKEILIDAGFALEFDKEVLAEVKKLQAHITR
ncbi:MAG: ribonuclease R, partial [Chitinophagaceae bacterium]|nr:ribonuclease R [Chitinophagaceae bacterium]